MNRTRPRKHVLFALILALFAGYFLWTSGRFVLAFNEQKRAHIFPKAATASGWNNAEAALAQDMADQAPLASFTQQNSAFVFVTTPIAENHTSAQSMTSESTVASSTVEVTAP